MITDNLGAQEMRSNNDGDAAAAMQRVTGISVVDNQYVFVRGLGERYSNTQLSGATLPTTEPDKKVVPLDMFPSGLLDSVQVAKSYSPDRSAEFAGGLVQVNPIKLPSRPVFDVSYGLTAYELATGKSIPLSPLGSRDWLGFDNGARALPSSFPNSKIVRRGVYTPNVGFTPDQITGFGRALDDTWRPVNQNGAPGQNWGVVAGNRFGKLGVVASLSHSYKEQFVQEDRAFYRVDEGDTLEAVSDYDIRYGTQRAQIGGVANLSYQLTTNHRVSLENFYTHSGKDEGRSFQGPNTENNFYYFNNRLQFIEEELLSNGLSGEHFFRSLGNSRIDWRATYSRAKRNEPDLRETLYQANLCRAAWWRVHLHRHAGAGRRVAERVPHVQRPQRRLARRGRQLEHVQHGRRPAHPVQVRRQPDRPHARLHVAPLPLHPQHRRLGWRGADRPAPDARGDLRLGEHRHGVPLQRGDASGGCLRRRPDRPTPATA